MGAVKSIARGIGDVLTGGAFTARKEGKKAKKRARQAEEELEQEREAETTRRRNFQRAALQQQPSLFDLLGGPDT